MSVQIISVSASNTLESANTVTFSLNSQVCTVEVISGPVIGSVMGKNNFFPGQGIRLHPVARNNKGHFVSIKGYELQLISAGLNTAKTETEDTSAKSQESSEYPTSSQLPLENIMEIKFESSMTNNKVRTILESLGLSEQDIHTKLKTNQSGLVASDLVFSALASASQPSDCFTDFVEMRNNILLALKSKGNYESETFSGYLYLEWNRVNKELKSNPSMFKAVKQWIIEVQAEASLSSHVKLKDVALPLCTRHQSTMESAAMEGLIPQQRGGKNLSRCLSTRDN